MKAKQDQLDFLCKRLSIRLNKSPEDFQPIIKILKENWYDTEDALRQATEKDYEKMNIPVRIVAAIQEELKKPLNKTQGKKKQEKKEQKFILNEQNMLKLTVQLKENLLSQYDGSKEIVNSILEIVLRLIGNIAKDPYEMKYRSLKKTNKVISKNIMENPPCLIFLRAIGFTEDEQIFYLHTAEVHQFIFLQDCLMQLVGKKNGFHKPKKEKEEQRMIQFQNFPQNKAEEPLNEEQLREMKYVDALDKLIEYRNKIMSQPPKDRKLKIYHKKYDKKNNYFPQVNLESEFQKSEDQMIASYWKNYIMENRKASNFQSKRKVEFQHLIKQNVYKETIIKVQLPNQLIIQAVFGPLQTLQSVYNYVTQIVIGDLYMFTAPPRKVMTAKEFGSALYDLHAVPTGLFYLGSDYQFYITNEYANKIQK